MWRFGIWGEGWSRMVVRTCDTPSMEKNKKQKTRKHTPSQANANSQRPKSSSLWPCLHLPFFTAVGITRWEPKRSRARGEPPLQLDREFGLPRLAESDSPAGEQREEGRIDFNKGSLLFAVREGCSLHRLWRPGLVKVSVTSCEESRGMLID